MQFIISIHYNQDSLFNGGPISFFFCSYLGNHFYIKLLLSEDATDTSTWNTKHKADGVVTCEEIENKFYFPQESLCLCATIMKMSIFWLKA